MKDTELKREKARALYAAYRKGLSEGRFTSMRDAGEYLRLQPAPRFYIDSRQASIYVGWILNNTSLINLNSSQRRMIHRLYKDYKKYLSEHPDTPLSRERIMEELVEQPAPEYYMTADAVRKTLRKEIRYIRSQWGW